MFERFRIEKMVKNKELLRSFEFSTIPTSTTQLLLIKKVSGTRDLSFVVDMGQPFQSFWNLLGQEYFPSSVSILTKIGKRVLNNYNGVFEAMLEKAIAGELEYAFFFGRPAVANAVSKYFRYKNISFKESRPSGLLVPYCRTKPELQIVEQGNHPLIHYFRNVATSCLYEKEVFDAVVKVFELEDESGSVDNLLEILILENNDLLLQSLFNKSEDDSLESVTYGTALAHSCSGGQVLQGDIPWKTFIRARGNSWQNALTPVNLGQTFTERMNRFEQLAARTRQSVLTAEASSHYNEEVPNLCYWNI